jgi:integrase
MRQKLTARFVETVRIPKAPRVEYHDELLPGLRLRIFSTGRKSFSVVGRVNGRQVRHTLGTYPTVSLSEARDAARVILRDMQLGKHISAEEEPPALRTLGDTVPEFIEKHAKPKNRDWKQSIGLFKRFEGLYDKPLAEIKRADIAKVLDSIMAEGKPYRTNRALAQIKKLFAWALDRGYIDVHPIVGLKPPAKEIARDRVLTDPEIQSLWRAAEELGFPFGPAIQLFLVTAQRRGEVTSMRWSQIDWQRGTWNIPAEVAKNGRVHEVPLSSLAIDILSVLPRLVGSDLVFTTTGTTPISGFGRVKERLDELMGVSDWRFHDLRRTAASGMARIGVAPHMIEKVLNHVTGQISGVAAVYNRHGYAAEKREALETWAGSLISLTRREQLTKKPLLTHNSSSRRCGAEFATPRKSSLPFDSVQP